MFAASSEHHHKSFKQLDSAVIPHVSNLIALLKQALRACEENVMPLQFLEQFDLGSIASYAAAPNLCTSDLYRRRLIRSAPILRLAASAMLDRDVRVATQSLTAVLRILEPSVFRDSTRLLN